MGEDFAVYTPPSSTWTISEQTLVQDTTSERGTGPEQVHCHPGHYLPHGCLRAALSPQPLSGDP
jgi:hypothetical protein